MEPTTAAGSTHLDLITLLLWFTGVVIFVILVLFALIKFFIHEKYKSITRSLELVSEMYNWFTLRKTNEDNNNERTRKLEMDFEIFKAEQSTERRCYLDDVRHIRDNIDNRLLPMTQLIMGAEDMFKQTKEIMEKVNSDLNNKK